LVRTTIALIASVAILGALYFASAVFMRVAFALFIIAIVWPLQSRLIAHAVAGHVRRLRLAHLGRRSTAELDVLRIDATQKLCLYRHGGNHWPDHCPGCGHCAGFYVRVVPIMTPQYVIHNCRLPQHDDLADHRRGAIAKSKGPPPACPQLRLSKPCDHPV
jgi:hypothetical protein